MAPYARFALLTRGEGGGAEQNRLCTTPSNCPWTRPATPLERGVDTASPALMPN